MYEMREWGEDELRSNFEAGRTIVVQRRDDPNLPQLTRMESEGYLTSRLVQLDEQSSVLKFRKAD